MEDYDVLQAPIQTHPSIRPAMRIPDRGQGIRAGVPQTQSGRVARHRHSSAELVGGISVGAFDIAPAGRVISVGEGTLGVRLSSRPQALS